LNAKAVRKHALWAACRARLDPPHPTWQSKPSRNRVAEFLKQERIQSPDGILLNLGSGVRRFGQKTLNLDLFGAQGVDIQGDVLHLPIKGESVQAIVCTGVLEHVRDPHRAVQEICRVLKPGGRSYFEVPFIQTFHASPDDFFRWTAAGLQHVLRPLCIVESQVIAGPASSLAWIFQETMAMLFSLRSNILYRIGLRFFGYLALPISRMDIVLEGHPMARQAASGFSVLAAKSPELQNKNRS
jgi:SAM-dependent methyltransferase